MPPSGRIRTPGPAGRAAGPGAAENLARTLPEPAVLAAKETGSRQRSQHPYILLLEIYYGGEFATRMGGFAASQRKTPYPYG